MITGYEQVRSIAADIAGDKEAAARVELELAGDRRLHARRRGNRRRGRMLRRARPRRTYRVPRGG